MSVNKFKHYPATNFRQVSFYLRETLMQVVHVLFQVGRVYDLPQLVASIEVRNCISLCIKSNN